MKTRAFGKKGSGGEPERKDGTFVGKIRLANSRQGARDGCRGSTGSTQARIAKRDTFERAAAPPAPRCPSSWRGGGCSSREGARRAAGRSGPLPLAASPACRTRRPGSRRGDWPRSPPWRRCRARREQTPGPGDGPVALEPPYAPPEKSLAPPPSAASPPRNSTRPAAGRRCRVAAGPRVSPGASDEQPPPRGRAPTRAPCSPRRPAPAARLPSSPGPDSGSPPAAAGPSAAPAPPGAPRLRRPPARTDHPPALRPAEAGGPAQFSKANEAGCPPGHPRPPISGGDPSRAGYEGRGQRARGPLHRGRPRPLSRRSASPARRARGRSPAPA